MQLQRQRNSVTTIKVGGTWEQEKFVTRGNRKKNETEGYFHSPRFYCKTRMWGPILSKEGKGGVVKGVEGSR